MGGRLFGQILGGGHLILGNPPGIFTQFAFIKVPEGGQIPEPFFFQGLGGLGRLISQLLVFFPKSPAVRTSGFGGLSPLRTSWPLRRPWFSSRWIKWGFLAPALPFLFQRGQRGLWTPADCPKSSLLFWDKIFPVGITFFGVIPN